MAKGTKTGGGSRKGRPNRKTAERRQAIEDGGLMPLDLMLQTLRDETKDLATRLDAAKSAAQYVHPRLSTVEAKHSGEVTIRTWKVDYA